MDKEYLTQVQDWLKWYNYHRSMMESMPLEQKVNFLVKANYGCVTLLAGLVDQLLPETPRNSGLLLPVGVRW